MEFKKDCKNVCDGIRGLLVGFENVVDKENCCEWLVVEKVLLSMEFFKVDRVRKLLR